MVSVPALRKYFLSLPSRKFSENPVHSITTETTVVGFMVQSEKNLPCNALSAKDVSECFFINPLNVKEDLKFILVSSRI